jgi:hypothetical protein
MKRDRYKMRGKLGLSGREVASLSVGHIKVLGDGCGVARLIDVHSGIIVENRHGESLLNPSYITRAINYG